MNESTVHPDLPSPSAHPDADALADHIEGLLSAQAATELDAHLTGCPECRETHDALLELQELLQAERSTADVPIPDDIAARIDAALAEAAAAPATEHAAAEETYRTTDGTTDSATDDVAGIAALGSDNASDAASNSDTASDSDSDSDSDEPAEPASAPSRGAGRGPSDNRPAARPGVPSRGRRRLRQAMVTLAVLVAAGGIGVAVSSGGDIDAGPSSASPAIGAPAAPQTSATRPATAGLVFTDAGLDGQVQAIVRQDAAGQSHTKAPLASLSPGIATASGTPTEGTHASPNGNGNGSGTALPTPSGTGTAAAPSASPSAAACVLAAAKQPGVPVHEAVGEYLGVQVFALIYPDTADPAHTWDVFLVQDSCSSPLVLLQRTVPRT